VTVEFLEHVITTPEGYFCLATLADGEWNELWFEWPRQKEEIIEAANRYRDTRSVYFTAHLFDNKRSTRQAVLPSRTLQADLDYAAVPRNLQPTVLVETSPDRHQGYWVLTNEPTSVEHLEQMSRSLTYQIPNCDKGCWQLGHKMRMPGMLNFKYKNKPPVKIVKNSLTTIKSLPLPSRALLRKATEENWEPIPLNFKPLVFLQKMRDQLPSQVYTRYQRVQTEGEKRSGALWGLMIALFRAGLDRDHVYYLALNSANNKFADNKYNGERDLKKDVLRAEIEAHKGSAQTIRDHITEVKRSNHPVAEKRRLIAEAVYQDMDKRGQFISTPEGEFFVREDTGQPLFVTRHSPSLDALIEERYWLNRTETEQHYTIAYLETAVRERAHKGNTGYLSYYNQESGVVLLHTGQRDVLEIGRDRINTIANGEYGVVFPWTPGNTPFELREQVEPFQSLLDGCFDNIIELSEPEARALLRAWFMFLFFRDAIVARPILALFGQPGAGKSTLFRRIYSLLYGRSKSVNSLTTPEDFDHAVSHDPLVVFDNVDTFTPWLPDKLALSASTSDLTKRKLYTDNDTSTLKRHALIGLTAHNPKFRREDIVDRLLLLNFKRLEVFKPEADILDKIAQTRDALWSGIARDIQKVLSTPYPTESEVPAFRISDFARAGLWIARALNFEADFRSALAINIKEQVAYNMEEEGMLIDALQAWLRHNKERQWKWITVSRLHSDLMLIAPEEFARTYPRSLTLGRKLWSLHDTLKTVFRIEFKTGAQREWRFAPL